MQKTTDTKGYIKKKILSNKVLNEIHVPVDPQLLNMKPHFQPWSPKGKFPMGHMNFLGIVTEMKDRVLVVSHGKCRHFAALIKWSLVFTRYLVVERPADKENHSTQILVYLAQAI